MIIRVAIDTDEMFFNINEDQWELIRALQDAGCLAKNAKIDKIDSIRLYQD